MLQRLSGGIDGQFLRRPGFSELPRRFGPSRCSEPAASASSPIGVVLRPGVVSQSPDGRRSARTVVVGAQSVTRPLAGDILVQFELTAVSFVDLIVVYQ